MQSTTKEEANTETKPEFKPDPDRLIPYLTPEAAAITRLSEVTLRTWACKGSGLMQPIEPRRPGAPLRWRPADVHKLAGMA